jgi:hypothetical protein
MFRQATTKEGIMQATAASRIGSTDHSRTVGRQLPYREIPAQLMRHAPFTGRSISAQRERDGSYVVYSYATIIATVDPSGKVDVIERNLWGPVSGRHINLCVARGCSPPRAH